MEAAFAQCVVLLWIRLIQPIWFASDFLWHSVHITLPYPRLFFSVVTRILEKGKFLFFLRASFPIACSEWLYKKAVWGVVKSWEFDGNLRCSKILRIRRKNSMKWFASISRDYWIYLDITCQSFKIWEFWGEFWGIETFHRSKFSPATGVMIISVPEHLPTFSISTWFKFLYQSKFKNRILFVHLMMIFGFCFCVFDDGLCPPTKDGCHAAPRDTLNILEVGSCPQYLHACSAQPRVSMSLSLWPWLAGKCPISPRPTG